VRKTVRCHQCRRGEEGFAGGLAGLVFGLLVFVVGTLVVSAAWGVIDTKAAVTDAARQAARSYIAAPSATAAYARALQAADSSLAGWSREPARARVSVLGGSFTRCSRVTLEVSYPAPLLLLPFAGRVGSAEWVSARQSELVSPYSSGLAGVAACP
jgi:Flp pilus assembly protein TadG